MTDSASIKMKVMFAACVCAAAGAFAWPAGTPQPNKYVLPPASDEVKAEAAAAKERLKDKVDKSRIAGHRGDSESAPENTIPAFKAAADGGFNIETDLYMTKDGVVFTTHDQFLRRKGNGMNTWSTNAVWKGQLENADAGVWMGQQWKGTKYPTIDDLLSFARDGRFIILEIKDPRKEQILPKIKEAIARHPNVNANNIFFQGARPRWLNKFLPGYRDIACRIVRKGWSINDEPDDIAAWIRKINPKDFSVVSLRWDEEIITKELIDLAHSRGIRVIVWTVNDAPSAWAALGRGVDWVCTDRPASLWKEMR